MFTFNSYNLSSIQWNAVDFDSIGSQFDFIKTPIRFDNGMKFNVFSFLNEIRDFSFNNKSGIFLTNLTNNKNIIHDKELPKNKSNLSSIQTILRDNNGNTYKHYTVNGLLSGLVASTDSFKTQDELIINFVDDYVYVEDYWGKVLTNGGFGDGQITFGPKKQPFTEYQKWNYFKNDDVLVLFSYNSNYSNILIKNNNNHLELRELNTSTPIQYSNTDIQNSVTESIDTVNAIINNYTNIPQTTPGGVISDTSFQNTYNIIIANKSKLQLQLVEFAKYQYPSAMNNSPTLSAKCYRDMGYVIDAVAADILNNANHRSIDLANMYFQTSLIGGTAIAGSSIPTLPASEVPATIDCVKKLKSYITGIAIPTFPTPFTGTGLITNTDRINDVSNRIDDIVYTLENNGQLKEYSPLGNPSYSNTFFSNIILQNKIRIQNDVKNYVASKNYLSNPVLLDKCNRDVGFIVDAIAHELNTGVLSKSIVYGLTYWDGVITKIPNSSNSNHKAKTTESFNQIKNTITSILNEQPSGSSAQNSPQNRPVPNTAYLFTKSYKDVKLDYESIVDSFIVKYDPSPIIDQSELFAIKDDLEYKQNYLGILPYEHLNENGKFNFYFHPLKNYQTAEYNYYSGQNNREYFKIYSGTNQQHGLNKIYLNYHTNKLAVNFKPDKLTDFYFSSTTQPISIHDSGLIQSGANGGNYPYSSDRLYTSKLNVFQEIPELTNIVKTTDTKNNKFLCSWLYDNKTTNTKIWYDRYFNSAYYTIDEALSASHMIYKKSLDGSDDLVYDVPSQVTLTPGVQYQYYHIGNKDSLKNLKHLNYKYDNSKGLINSNVLNITSWNSGELNDESEYKNDGLTYGNPNTFYGDHWKLDGSNYALFQANDILLEQNKFTVSLWLNFENWKNVNAYQIFGNYYNSGFGLVNDAKTISPLITLINNASNKIYNLNFKFTQASNAKTVAYHWDIVQRLSDMSYWLFDSKSCVGIKYNVNNSIISKDSLGQYGAILFNQFLTKISQVETDSVENLYIYDKNTKIYIVINKDGELQRSSVANSNSQRIEIDLYDNVVDGNRGGQTVYGNCSVIDNNNTLWQIIGSNLYKNGNVMSTVGASNQMSCDIYNNIWIISEDDAYTKFDENGNLMFRYDFSKSPLIGQTNCPPAQAPEPVDVTVLDEDLPFLSTTNKRYILTYDDFQEILVTPPLKKPKPVITDITDRTRHIDFINIPTGTIDNNLISICGLSAIETDQLIMVDSNDNQAYIINQLGQLVLKINLENLIDNGDLSDFFTGGDFTGYQNCRKYKNLKNTTFSWKLQTATKNGDVITNSISHSLSADVSKLSNGWHNFVLAFDSFNGNVKYYIDSVLVNVKQFRGSDILYYNYRTSLLLGATTVKNTILNNFLNLGDGYRMIGSVGDLKMYNFTLNEGDVEHLYYSSPFSPKIKTLKWNMEVGYRNYVEEITEWFQFQLPTNKSKYFNVNVHNLNFSDEIKKNIELAIKGTMGKLSPAHTVLNEIKWK